MNTALLKPGVRKAQTHQLIHSEFVKQWKGLPPDVSRGDIMNVLERTTTLGNLSAANYARLRTLMRLSQDQDWERGTKPVVSPSNEYLQTEWGLSRRAVQNTLQELAAGGYIVFVDSPNGRRYYSRDAAGRLLYAYGFDLSPCYARYLELIPKLEQREEEYIARRAARREFTAARRNISAMLRGITDGTLPFRDTSDFEPRFLALLNEWQPNAMSVRLLEYAVERVKELEQELEDSLVALVEKIDIQKTDTKGAVSCTDIQITNSVSKVKTSNSHLQNGVSGTDGGKPSTSLPLVIKKDSAGAPLQTTQTHKKKRQNPLKGISASQLALLATDEIRTLIPAQGRMTYEDLVRAVSIAHKWYGISTEALGFSMSIMGSYNATAAVMIIAKKLERDSKIVNNPSAYLIGMARAAQEGSLHLNRTIFGLLNDISDDRTVQLSVFNGQ